MFDPDAVLDDPARLAVPTGFARLTAVADELLTRIAARPNPAAEGLSLLPARPSGAGAA